MADWSREEVEATVSDYLEMLAADLSGVPYNKASHRRRLLERLNNRSEASIEFKHANISAVLIDLGFPYIAGYKPRSNYQSLLFDVVADRLAASSRLLEVAAADAEQPIVVPEVDDILSVLTSPPQVTSRDRTMSEPSGRRVPFAVDYLEREARNRSLGAAGEEFVITYERARLIRSGRDRLAGRIEHVSRLRGDGEGFDILSFEESGQERLIEVKTTKYGQETPFFLSRNELAVSESRLDRYHLYRLFRFKVAPQLFILDGAISKTCALQAASYIAVVRA
ncbi:MAG: DUF3883 domain-containing protein [Betaproteobacteria bacterium]